MKTFLCCVVTVLSAAWLSSAEPNQTGPLKVITASWLGGAGEEQIVGAEVRDDQSLVLAINAAELKIGRAHV